MRSQVYRLMLPSTHDPYDRIALAIGVYSLSRVAPMPAKFDDAEAAAYRAAFQRSFR